jgi:hypothetical protein
VSPDLQEIAMPGRTMLTILWRVVVAMSVAYWLGGLLFYASVVIPTAHEVLGSHREVGFITRRVTVWINLIACCALVVLLGDLLAGRPAAAPRRGIWLTWGLLAAAQAGLIVLHPRLDRLLDPATHSILARASFYPVHRVYLLLVTMQLAVGVVHIWHVLSRWRLHDGGEFVITSPNRTTARRP